jgi:Peptidase family M23
LIYLVSDWGLSVTVIILYGVSKVRSNHNGVDIAIGGDPFDQPVVAAKSGTVEKIENKFTNNYGKEDAADLSTIPIYGGYANYVRINHGGGLKTTYAHLGSVSVSEGQVVNVGQQIGIMGATGNSTAPHLHFAVEINGVNVNPQLYVFKGDGNANTQQSALVCNTTARDGDEVAATPSAPTTQYGGYNIEDTTDKRNLENTAYTCDNYPNIEALRSASSEDIDNCIGSGTEEWLEKEVEPNTIRQALIDKAIQDQQSSDISTKAQGLVMQKVWESTNDEILLCVIDSGELSGGILTWIDTIISVVPVFGDIYQIIIAIAGRAFGGKSGCVERWLNGVFGTVGLVSSIFTAGGGGVAADIVKIAIRESLKKGGRKLLQEAAEQVSKKLLQYVFTEILNAVINQAKYLLFTGSVTGIVYTLSPELKNSNSASVNLAVSAASFAFVGKSSNGNKARFATKQVAHNVPNHIQKSRNEISNKIGNAVGSYNLCAGQFTSGQRQKAKVQCHHLVEKRMYNKSESPLVEPNLNSNIPTVALTKEQHQVITNELRNRMPYSPASYNYTKQQIKDKYTEAYNAAGMSQYLPQILATIGN